MRILIYFLISLGFCGLISIAIVLTAKAVDQQMDENIQKVEQHLKNKLRKN